MIQNYQDAMVICRHYKNPDLFITFTYNSKWYEITRTLAIITEQKTKDRPNIVARVFKMKLDHILSNIKSEAIFKKIIIDLFIVEFQKQDLPHCYFFILVIP